MNIKRLRRAALALAVVSVVTAGGFFAGRWLVGEGTTEADQPSIVERLDALEKIKAAEDGEARFTGELLGLNLAPTLEELPADVQQARDIRLAGGCVAIPVAEARHLDFAQPLRLPDRFVRAESSPEATACSGSPSGLTWEYTATGAGGIPAMVTVLRNVTREFTPDVPASRISVIEVGGRNAVLISPSTSDGLGQTSQVLFPEASGMTTIHAFNLSESDLLEVAKAVAEASR